MHAEGEAAISDHDEGESEKHEDPTMTDSLRQLTVYSKNTLCQPKTLSAPRGKMQAPWQIHYQDCKHESLWMKEDTQEQLNT